MNKLSRHTRDLLIAQQLDNIATCLNATVHHQVCLDSYGKESKRIIITYEEPKRQELESGDGEVHEQLSPSYTTA